MHNAFIGKDTYEMYSYYPELVQEAVSLKIEIKKACAMRQGAKCTISSKEADIPIANGFMI